VSVSPAGATVPSGTVSFSDNAGPIANCQGLPVTSSAPYTATCTTSFAAPGSVSIGAAFSSSSTSVTGSSGSASVAVQAGYLVLTSNGGLANFHAPWYGSLNGHLPEGVSATGIAADPVTGGYWILTSNGGLANFHAPWYGSLNGHLPEGVSATGIATD